MEKRSLEKTLTDYYDARPLSGSAMHRAYRSRVVRCGV